MAEWHWSLWPWMALCGLKALPGNPGMPGMLAAAPHSMKGLTFKAKKKLKAKHMTQSHLVYSFESQSWVKVKVVLVFIAIIF